MNQFAKNRLYRHLFVVMRCDDDYAGPIEQQVSLVATFATEIEADAEAKRLAGLNGSRYVVMTTRFKGRGPLPAMDPSVSSSEQAARLLKVLSANEQFPEHADTSEQVDWMDWIEVLDMYAGMLSVVATGGRTESGALRRARELRAEANSSTARWPERWGLLEVADELLDQCR